MAKRRNPQPSVIVTADDEEVASGNPLPVTSGTGDNVIGRVKITDGTDVALVTAGGLLQVDASGATVPVSNAALTELAAAIDTELQVDVVGALPAGTNAIGKLAANSGVDIGDVDILSIAAGDNNIGNVDVASITNGSINGPAAPTIDSYTTDDINLAAGANQSLKAGAANKQIWVYGIGFTLSVAGTVSFQDEDDAAITGIMAFAANSGLAIPPSGNFAMPLWKVPTAKALEVDIVTADVDGWISYAVVSV